MGSPQIHYSIELTVMFTMATLKPNQFLSPLKIQVNNPCLVCGSTQSELVFEKQYLENGYPGIFSIRRCHNCGLWFNSPRLEDRLIPYLYEKNYYFFNRTDDREFLRIYDLYKRSVFLLKDKVNSKKVLEIGSSKGYLLALLKNLGWTVQGIEISSEASRYARRKFGIVTFTGTVDEYRQKENRDSFPLVLVMDVLEHIPHPDQFLRDLHTLVQKDGWIMFDTPNGDAGEIADKNADWIGFNPYHIFIFSESNLSVLLKNYGFKIEAVHFYNHNQFPLKCDSKGKMSLLKDMVKAALQAVGLFKYTKSVCENIRQAVENVYWGGNPLAEAIRKAQELECAGNGIANVLNSNRASDNMLVIARKI